MSAEISKRSDQLRWYAIYVRSRFEKKVHRQLVQKQVEAYLALIEEIRRWSDRKKKVEEPLFKGYVFVRIDLRDRLRVLQADGVIRFVGIRDQPSAISDKEIESIRIVLSADGKVKREVRREEFPAIGDPVEVIAGPLRGIRGIVLEARGNTRLAIQVEAIARAFSVEVRPDLLKKLS